MIVEQRIREQGLEIPDPPTPKGAYLPGAKVGNLIFTSGTSSVVKGERTFVGKVGKEISLEEAQESAKIAVLNNLAIVKAIVGDLDRIRVIKLTGYVNSAPGFDKQPAVIDGASKFLQAIMGDKGKHARTAIGAAELPFGISVEIDMVVEVIIE